MIYKCTLEAKAGDVIDGFRVLTNLQDFYIAITSGDVTRIEFCNDFLNQFFPGEMLNTILIEIRKMYPTVMLNIEPTPRDLVNRFIERLNLCASATEMMDLIVNNEDTALSAIDRLCATNENEALEDLNRQKTINNLYTIISEVETQLKAEKSKNERLINNSENIKLMHDTLVSRIKYSNRIGTEAQDIYHLEASLNTYKRILYIKEITRVKYVDSLISYVQKEINALWGTSARIIVIEPQQAFMRKSLYKDFASFNDLTYQDVISSNIFMAGFQHDLMKDIIKNTNRDMYLIILDRTAYHKVYLEAPNVEVVYTVSDLKDLPLAVAKNRLISYDQNTLHIPYEPNFEKLNSLDKMSTYAQFPIMNILLDLIERGTKLREEEDNG